MLTKMSEMTWLKILNVSSDQCVTIIRIKTISSHLNLFLEVICTETDLCIHLYEQTGHTVQALATKYEI